jgi:SAM-dependent methyltransferase
MSIPLSRSLRERGLRFWKRAVRPAPAAENDGLTAFVCNLCSTPNRVLPSQLARETSSCSSCGSTVRFRSIAWLVVRELFGGDWTLPEVPDSRHIVGIGLSDAQSYAVALARRFSYTNTFFDAEPMLDITAVPDSLAGRHDFVIASDVFEHVAPPVSRAFHGARRLLRPDGVLILTVPFSLDPDTVEHFPDLHDFRIVDVDGRRQLHNVTRDGREQTFDDLVFHGGIGATLEMRVFSRAALERELREAGFSRVRFADEACPRFGIVRPEPSGVPIVARP